MSRQKNSEEGYGVLLQQVSTFQAKITDIIAARGSDLFEVQFLNLCNLPFDCYLKQKMPLFL
jgi:hypothetical protein